ncbi:hypothetical protein SPSIL_045570 [Sporomusa silvacetica DSM 10669]|uniref:Small, acid-soluble spore protein gamma-type n=1 Tax=Sporomusa silvacetica DSM 10669 TaxID=1123289 RepID=A0ABZ3IRL5_9FIRM|nr:hypothetical protein [Sporomusa silvacetica]OZC20814.1 hypothetical protein SPSIL_16850 [Sporomusa silvacetica DSM 10669]
MTKGDSGATQQDIFNKNVSEQAMVKYNNPATSGKIQDKLRNRRDPNIHS